MAEPMTESTQPPAHGEDKEASAQAHLEDTLAIARQTKEIAERALLNSQRAIRVGLFALILSVFLFCKAMIDIFGKQ